MLSTLAFLFLALFGTGVLAIVFSIIFDLDERVIRGAIATTIVSLILALVFGISSDVTRYNAMLEHCLADGHKEYECYSILLSRRR